LVGTLEREGRAELKNQLPRSSRDSSPPFARLAPGGCRGAGRSPAVGRGEEVTAAYLTRATPRRRPPAMETDAGADDGDRGRRRRPPLPSPGRYHRVPCVRPPRHHHPAADPLDEATRDSVARWRRRGGPRLGAEAEAASMAGRGSPHSILGGEGRSGVWGSIRVEELDPGRWSSIWGDGGGRQRGGGAVEKGGAEAEAEEVRWTARMRTRGGGRNKDKREERKKE
jgi:hypothetical protein